MQPWLDMEVRETGCRRCGHPLRAGDVHVGAGMGGVALGRLLMLLGALATLWLAGGPLAQRWAPNFTAAFHRNGATGR